MGKILSLLTVCVLSVLLLSACKKDNTVPTRGTMSFKIDGVLYTSDAPWYAKAYGPASNNAKMVFVSSVGSNNMKYPSLEIDFPDSTAAGTFSITPNGSVRSSASFSYSGQDPVYNATSGQVIITQRTEILITGTFQFVLTSAANPSITKVVTEGTFNVPLTSGLLF